MRLAVAPCAALASALLSGVSVPLLKTFTENFAPQSLACLIYLGSALGLACVAGIRFAAGKREAPLRRSDMPRLILGTLLGSVSATFLLILGLSHTNSASASLLLTLTNILAAVFAWIFFREPTSRRAVISMCAVAAGAIILTYHGAGGASTLFGPLCILGSCLLWALDGNVMSPITATDPIHIAGVRYSLAGCIHCGIAFGVLHLPVPNIQTIAIVGAAGFCTYGLCLVFSLTAMRHLGVARSNIYFATAPFIGVAIAQGNGTGGSGWGFAAATLLMAAGMYLHLTERHTTSQKKAAHRVIAINALGAEA
jgi:drug/metabolite transporter (DMT)-like permease